MTLLIVIAIVLTFILYKRYFPAFGVHCINLKDIDLDKIKVLDIRDYNDSYNNLVQGAINIPIAYLKRNINQIPNNDLHLVASHSLEKNVGIRFLRKRGFRVAGYTIINDHRTFFQENHLKMEDNC